MGEIALMLNQGDNSGVTNKTIRHKGG